MKLNKILIMSIIILLIIFSFLPILFYHGTFGSHLILQKSSFAKLPGWKQDHQNQALLAFQQSCNEILKRDKADAFGNQPHFGNVIDWQKICNAAIQLNNMDDNQARQFFETWFQPYLVTNNYNATGLFTGYYLPTLTASLKKLKPYVIPIYGKPKDLITVNLGDFNNKLMGLTIKGQVKDQKLLPYPDRTAINQGALQKTAPVLAWTNDKIGYFFMQIQGSGLVKLTNGKTILLGYDVANGRPYTAIGRELLRKGLLNKHDVSMESIKSWLNANPQQADRLMETNQSYVFFRKLPGETPVGNEGVPLTPERSLATDARYIALGAPIWLDTSIPNNGSPNKKIFQRLLIAQDTGGAIKGIIRGDIYFGAEPDAAFIAGHLKSHGRYWVLLPKLNN